MGHDSSLQCSLEATIQPRPEPDESSLYTLSYL